MRENLVQNQKRQNSNFSRGGATITEGARSGRSGSNCQLPEEKLWEIFILSDCSFCTVGEHGIVSHKTQQVEDPEETMFTRGGPGA